METRKETDSLGAVHVPGDAYYGAQTQRAVDNFPATGLRFSSAFISALALIKRCAAEVNRDLGLLDPELAAAIVTAAKEVMDGEHHDQFVVDILQTGSGTSTNMNMNEVIAARSNEILTGQKGGKSPVHPNDHVNLGQSSNDVIPTTIHVAAAIAIDNRLLPGLKTLRESFEEKAIIFSAVPKIGRTHHQDAVPITLGQEFSGYARQVELGAERIAGTMKGLNELALGGTAVGNGLNTHPEFARRCIRKITDTTDLQFHEAHNHFEAQAAKDAAVHTSGALRTVAVSLVKMANDLRLLGSGPRCGIGELKLPALQPGSSIMPGKVNPVIPESVIQAAYQVIGNDTTITLCGQSGTLELNVTMPVLAYNLLQSIELLSVSVHNFARNCIAGLEADDQVCGEYIEKSMALVTAFVPRLGYDKAADLAKKAYASGKTIRQVALEEKVLPEQEIHQLLGGSMVP
ncbi:MAG: class II fumarate hydratase [Desulfobacteraceae bacterium]|nr:class II fumarate hydratase [Desulfobacteraceae bacterium]